MAKVDFTVIMPWHITIGKIDVTFCDSSSVFDLAILKGSPLTTNTGDSE